MHWKETILCDELSFVGEIVVVINLSCCSTVFQELFVLLVKLEIKEIMLVYFN